MTSIVASLTGAILLAAVVGFGAVGMLHWPQSGGHGLRLTVRAHPAVAGGLFVVGVLVVWALLAVATPGGAP